jgi:cyanophycin synthetase
VGDRRIAKGDCAGATAARNMLTNPYVEAAVLETSSEGILLEGLGYDRCEVAIVTDLGASNEAGRTATETADLVTVLERTVLWALAPNGVAVLPAAEPLVARLGPISPKSTIYFKVAPCWCAMVRSCSPPARRRQCYWPRAA